MPLARGSLVLQLTPDLPLSSVVRKLPCEHAGSTGRSAPAVVAILVCCRPAQPLLTQQMCVRFCNLHALIFRKKCSWILSQSVPLRVLLHPKKYSRVSPLVLQTFPTFNYNNSYKINEAEDNAVSASGFPAAAQWTR